MSLYVVTGGAGFLGSHVAAHLGEAGHDVRVLDNLTGDGARERAKFLCAVPHVELVDGDVRDETLCRRICADAEFVVHLAATHSEDAAECASVNVGGTVTLLDAARAAGTVKRFVYASTGAVYGDAPGGARHEASLPDPICAFASSKLSGEFFCRAAFRRHGLPAVILRFFSIYGPGASSGVVHDFCDAVRQNSPLPIDGDGEQSRDFLFVSDAVEACLRAAHASRGTGGKVFNIGSGTRISVNQIAEKMEQWTGRKLEREKTGRANGRYSARARGHRGGGWPAPIRAERPFRRRLGTYIAIHFGILSGEVRAMNICVIGTGYVGLVTGVVFSDLGNDVVCVDKNAAKIDGLNKGVMPIYEPGLEEMVARNVADGRLVFSTKLDDAVAKAEVVFIAVGTPPKDDGSTDLSYVEDAAKGIAAALNRYKVIVNKSTVPVGTGNFVRETIEANKRRAVDFDVVSNPEFLREGSAITDTLVPDRIVIGAPIRIVAMRLLELYAPLERPMIVTDIASAEMIKYASNAFLATKISFANAIANICEAAGADVTQVVKGMGLDTRIGTQFLHAGLGYGGSCFPKDTRSLLHTANNFGVEFPLLDATIQTNDAQPKRFIAKIHDALGGDDLKGKTVGVLGLAFKANTDDMREAKSLDVIADLLASGATVKAYDPIAIENTKAIFPQITYGANAYEVAAGCDALVVVTEWNEFKLLNFERIQGIMARPLILDGRNLYDPERMRRLGFEYHSVGRASILPSGTLSAADAAARTAKNAKEPVSAS